MMAFSTLYDRTLMVSGVALQLELPWWHNKNFTWAYTVMVSNVALQLELP